MYKIEIKGYDELNKVGMTKAIQNHTELSLKESKSVTDTLLETGSVTIEIESRIKTQELLKSLQEANVKTVVLTKY